MALVVEDDEDSPELSEQITRRLIARNVTGIVGGMRSAVALAGGNAAAESKVVYITPLSGSTALALAQPARDRYLFQTVWRVTPDGGFETIRNYGEDEPEELLADGAPDAGGGRCP